MKSPVSKSSSESDEGVWSPSGHKQGGKSDSDFSDADLSWFLILVAIATQRSNVHLLGLSLKSLFVFADRFHDLRIEEDEEGEGDAVWGEEDGADEEPSRGILSHVIERASGQESLWKYSDQIFNFNSLANFLNPLLLTWYESSPNAQEWHDGEGSSPQPDTQNHHHNLLAG